MMGYCLAFGVLQTHAENMAREWQAEAPRSNQELGDIVKSRYIFCAEFQRPAPLLVSA